MTSSSLSNTILLLNRYFRIYWLSTQLMPQTKKPLWWRIFMESLILCRHHFFQSQRKGLLLVFLEVTHNGLHWPPQDEEFIIFLQKDGWSLGSFQAYNDKTDSITLQCLKSLKTRAQDNLRKTYWKMLNCCNVSISVANNIKWKDLVFALLHIDALGMNHT